MEGSTAGCCSSWVRLLWMGPKVHSGKLPGYGTAVRLHTLPCGTPLAAAQASHGKGRGRWERAGAQPCPKAAGGGALAACIGWHTQGWLVVDAGAPSRAGGRCGLTPVSLLAKSSH